MTAVPSGWTPEQARKRLEAATPGEWFAIVNDLVGGWSVSTVDKPLSQIDTPNREARFPADFCSEADAVFIANAPTDIAALLALLDAARETLEMRRWSDKCPDCYCDVWTGRHSDACEATRAFLARFAADKDGDA